jgi:DNA-binding MarR family transcriptional regulator
VSRQPSHSDRRKITLRLTPGGQKVLDEARTSTQARLVDLMGRLSGEQCETVFQALQLLNTLFLPAGDKIVPGEKQL